MQQNSHVRRTWTAAVQQCNTWYARTHTQHTDIKPVCKFPKINTATSFANENAIISLSTSKINWQKIKNFSGRICSGHINPHPSFPCFTALIPSIHKERHLASNLPCCPGGSCTFNLQNQHLMWWQRKINQTTHFLLWYRHWQHCHLQYNQYSPVTYSEPTKFCNHVTHWPGWSHAAPQSDNSSTRRVWWWTS